MFQGGNTGKPEVGVSFAHPFANIVKSSNIWEVAQGAATDFTQDRQTEFITDASDGLILGKTLYAGMETVADADNELLGDYVVRWTGDAEMAFNPTGGSTPPVSGWVSQGGQLTFSVTSGNGIGALFARNTSGSQIASFVVGLDCVKYSDFPGATIQDQINAAWASYDAGNIFTPEMLALWADVSCARMLNWTNSMANNTVEWSERAVVESLSYASFRDGLNCGWVPYEVQVQFAQAINAEAIWLHVPTFASNAFVQSFAQLLESLAQGIRIILQVGNEIWNFGGEFAHHTKSFGLRNLGGATLNPIQTALVVGNGFILAGHGLQNGQYICPIQNEHSLQNGEDNASLLHGAYYDAVNDNYTRYKRVVNAAANTFELETYGDGVTGTSVVGETWETEVDFIPWPVGNDPDFGVVQDFATSYGERLAYIYDVMRLNAPTKWAAGEFVLHVDSQFSNAGLGTERVTAFNNWVTANAPAVGSVTSVSIAPYTRSDENLFFANLSQTAGGSGYSVDDVLNLTGVSSAQTDMSIRVTSVDGGGAITGWEWVYYGADEYYYLAPSGESVSHAGGFTGDVTWGRAAPTNNAELLQQVREHVDYRVVPEIQSQYQAHVDAGQTVVFDLYEFGFHDTDPALASLVGAFQSSTEIGTATTYYLNALDNSGVPIRYANWYTFTTRWLDENYWGLVNSTGQALSSPKVNAYKSYQWEGVAASTPIIGVYTAIEGGELVVRERTTDYEHMQQIVVASDGVYLIDHPLNLSLPDGANLTLPDGRNLDINLT